VPALLDENPIGEPVKVYLYAATEVTVPEPPAVMLAPVIDGKIIAVRWIWAAQTPWWYFATQEPLDGLDVAPETYPNGNPVALPDDPDWQEPQK
jgi:hypothetical protein